MHRTGQRQYSPSLALCSGLAVCVDRPLRGLGSKNSAHKRGPCTEQATHSPGPDSLFLQTLLCVLTDIRIQGCQGSGPRKGSRTEQAKGSAGPVHIDLDVLGLGESPDEVEPARVHEPVQGTRGLNAMPASRCHQLSSIPESWFLDNAIQTGLRLLVLCASRGLRLPE